MLKEAVLIIALVFTATGCLLLPYTSVMVMVTRHAFSYLGVGLLLVWVSLVGYAMLYIRKVFSDNPAERRMAVLFMLVLLVLSWVMFAYVAWQTDRMVTM